MRGLSPLLLLALCCAPGHLTPSDEDDTMKLPAAGLFTNPNPLEKAPPGALSRAMNVVMDRDGVADVRPGQEPQADFATAPLALLLEHEGSLHGLSQDGNLYRDVDTVPVLAGEDGGDFGLAPLDLPIAASVGGALVLPTAQGVVVAEADEIRPAGTPAVPDLLSGGIGVDTGLGWLPAGASVGYRWLLARKGPGGLLLRGAPSSRLVDKNVSGSAISPHVTAPLPAGTTTEMFAELYRTASQEDGGEPGDSMQKVAELPVTEAALAAGQLVFVDVAPDGYRGEALYTNAAQDGLAGARARPPLARVVGAFRDVALYGDAMEPRVLRVRLLTNLDDGNVVTLTVGATAHVFTGNDTSDFIPDTFRVGTVGTASQNIEYSARGLVEAINARGTGILARYESGPNDPPGMIALEAESLADGTSGDFSLSISTGPARFLPALPQSSSRIQRRGRTYYSLQGQPGAVRLDGYVEAGDGTRPVLAYAALRDSLFVFKDDGLFRLLPLSGGGFTWEPFNDSVRLLAPRTVAVLENRAYALTNKGVVSISDAGVEEVSAAFSPTLDAALAQVDAATLRTRAFAVAHETQKRLLLWLPETSGSPVASHAFVFNLSTETWTERNDAATCAAVTAARGLVLGLGGTEAAISLERRTGTLQDRQDADGVGIGTDVAWVPDALGAGGVQKQFRDASAVFLHDVPAGAAYTFGFTADAAAELTASVPAEGGPYVRAEVPQDAQRCTRLGLRVQHTVLLEDYALAGLEVRVRAFAGRLAR